MRRLPPQARPRWSAQRLRLCALLLLKDGTGVYDCSDARIARHGPSQTGIQPITRLCGRGCGILLRPVRPPADAKVYAPELPAGLDWLNVPGGEAARRTAATLVEFWDF